MLFVCPPKFCVRIVFVFSCDHCNSQEKLETMLMQNLGGQTKSIMVFSEVVYLRIHVERAISRIKTFKILHNVFPINQAGLCTFGEFSVINLCTINNNCNCLLLP